MIFYTILFDIEPPSLESESTARTEEDGDIRKRHRDPLVVQASNFPACAPFGKGATEET